MKKSQMFKAAHEIAHEIVGATDNYQIAFSFALKEVWRQVKTYNKKRFGDAAIVNAGIRLVTTPEMKRQNEYVEGVPTWIIRKNLNEQEAFAVCNTTNSFDIVRETEKAELVSFNTDYGYVEMWTPKSVLAVA
ncbi:hypothetical protein IWT25_00681 [Secundilactobacillus pentosiphilus]|uniref:Uncharacterized protein n=1 Tax=Secundilactobacillus pentosiphilus TaxID=1714682 RepID=A0A1Z5IUG1_9LACO|nr:hypothetical protein [Secundilactobacillus pentosiphilus]GAX05377.1 hypothetical protein IWT25_00681 [Secundilactobacillus pentosiphilus]